VPDHADHADHPHPDARRLVAAALALGCTHHTRLEPDDWPQVGRDLDARRAEYLAVSVSDEQGGPLALELFSSAAPGRPHRAERLERVAAEARLRTWLRFRRRSELTTSPGLGKALATPRPAAS
jgi:hypothetical protein